MFYKQFPPIFASIFGLFIISVLGQVPQELESTKFSDASSTPSPACLCAAPTGEVFVGVDMLGSLGKGPGKGKIIRLVDKDGDGIADQKTVYANLDNPRGLVALGGLDDLRQRRHRGTACLHQGRAASAAPANAL